LNFSREISEKLAHPGYLPTRDEGFFQNPGQNKTDCKAGTTTTGQVYSN